jgi:hypothetical protein
MEALFGPLVRMSPDNLESDLSEFAEGAFIHLTSTMWSTFRKKFVRDNGTLAKHIALVNEWTDGVYLYDLFCMGLLLTAADMCRVCADAF